MRHVVILMVLTLTFAGSLAGKGDLPTSQKFDQAALIAFGRVHNIKPTSQETVYSARMDLLAVFKGSTQPGGAVPVNFYGKGVDEGYSALWVMVDNPAGGYQDTYPWMRLEPTAWPEMPPKYWEAIQKATNYAAGQPVEGLSLRLMILPCKAGQPLQVWLLAKNEAAQDRFLALDTVRFDVTRPDRLSASNRLFTQDRLRELTTQPDLSFLTVKAGDTVALRCPGRPSSLTSVYEQTLPGKYVITAQATFNCPDDDVAGIPKAFVASVSSACVLEEK